MLCDIAGMINLVHKPRRKPYLVAVGAVACRSGGHELLLRKLAGYGVLDPCERIGAAGNAHGVIDIAPAGQGIAYCAAHAGGSTAERLYLRGMVVGFVLEQEQPRLVFAVNIDIDPDRAGVYLVRFVKVPELSALFERLCRNAGKVHETDALLISRRLSEFEISFKGSPNPFILKFGIDYLGIERGMPAMIRPIGIYDPKLGHRGLTVFGSKIILKHHDIRLIHGKPVALYKLARLGLGKRNITDACDLGLFHLERIGHGKLRLP